MNWIVVEVYSFVKNKFKADHTFQRGHPLYAFDDMINYLEQRKRSDVFYFPSGVLLEQCRIIPCERGSIKLI